MRIVDQDLWDRVQVRLAEQEASPPRKAGVDPNHHFWERRRPKHLLTGKIVCSSCASPFSALGKDYLGCLAAKHGTCRNISRVRRGSVEKRVLDALRHQLMQPEHVELFVKEFTTEWSRLTVKAAASAEADQRELAAWELQACQPRRCNRGRCMRLACSSSSTSWKPAGRLYKVTSPSPPCRRRCRIRISPKSTAASLPNSMRLFRARTILRLSKRARALVDRVIVSPPKDDGPPGIELIGELTAMLGIAGLASAKEDCASTQGVLSMFASAVKAASGGKAP